MKTVVRQRSPASRTTPRQKGRHPLASGQRAAGDIDVLALTHELRTHQAAIAQLELELAEVRRQNALLRAQHREVYELAPVALATLDERGAILECNLALPALLGASRKSILGTALADRAPRSGRDALDRYVRRAFASDEKTQCEVDLCRMDGMRLRVHVQAVAMGDGEERRLLMMVSDVTERERTEAELRRFRKMEAVGRVTSAVSHDFNNLLMGIAGTADIALAGITGARETRALVEQIRAAALRGATLTGKLVQLGEREPRAAASTATATDLGEVVRRSRTMLRGVLGDGIELKVTISNASARVRVEPVELERILMNLATNARRAMSGRGRLHVQVLRYDTTRDGAQPGLATGRYVLLLVKDTGVGMDAATRRRIFDPFFSGRPGGTGLGLATVQDIVSRAGGRIGVESEIGQGTTIRVLLPRVVDDEDDDAEPPRRPTSTAPPPRPSDEGPPADVVAKAAPSPRAAPAEGDREGEGAGRTVLVLEDEPAVRRSVRHYLERAGHRVLEAGSGAEAREVAARAGRLDLVVADVDLGGESGPAVARGLAGKQPGLPVLYISGQPVAALAAAGRLPRGERALRKPFDDEVLLAEVRRALRPDREATAAGTVLLVEDNEMSRVALGLYLANRGYRVLAAESGAEALKISTEHAGPIDAVVTDLGLRDTDGHLLVDDIRAVHASAAVVFISGRDRKDRLVKRALHEQRAAFLRKPFDLEALAKTLSELVSCA